MKSVLPNTFKKYGHQYVKLDEKRHAAIYEVKRHGYEVIRKTGVDSEYPSSSKWGVLGWTFTQDSYKNAIDKYHSIR